RGDTAQIYAGCPDTSLVPFDSAYVMCDGPYLAHVRDPATAPPNLAAVQEIAAGIWRVNSRVFLDQAELWVDDIRLSDVVQDAGFAGAIAVTLTAAHVADVAVSGSRRGAQFRPLGGAPRCGADAGARPRAAPPPPAARPPPSARPAGRARAAGGGGGGGGGGGAGGGGGIRLAPAAVRFHSGLAGDEGSRLTYAVPVARVADSG